MITEPLYYTKYAAAYIRGIAMRHAKYESGSMPGDTPASEQPPLVLPSRLVEKDLHTLPAEDLEEIIAAGKAAGLKLHRFKSTYNELPRVRRVMGFLRSIEMESLLDVGSGRGVFLWPCLQAFPHLHVLSIDLLPHRIGLLNTVREGGIANLMAIVGDIRMPPVGLKTYDVVTILEVLEHIPDVLTAIQAAVRIAKKYIVVTVPSKPDNNPEHIHLLTKGALADIFNQAGCARLHFDAVPGHLVLSAALERF